MVCELQEINEDVGLIGGCNSGNTGIMNGWGGMNANNTSGSTDLEVQAFYFLFIKNIIVNVFTLGPMHDLKTNMWIFVLSNGAFVIGKEFFFGMFFWEGFFNTSI